MKSLWSSKGARFAVVCLLCIAIAFAIASGVRPEQGIYTAIIGGFLIGMLTLVVPLTGVLMDRKLLPIGVEAGQLPFRPVSAGENPENPGPGRRAPDR